ncbi:MAG TPA: hypothetical protein VEK79_12470 [Thermoanaerobaculia bacterium]|nr:hypothetical protein [Thermoanaerobaculia bacterium]
MNRIILIAAVALLANGCSTLGQLAWQAMDQAGRYSTKRIAVDEIQVPDGHQAVRIVNGLNFPSSFTWDAAGNLYILESHTVPAPMLKPKIVRVRTNGAIDRVRLEGPHAPNGDTAIGITFHDGWLYFSHEMKDGTFAIQRVRPEGGNVETIVGGMPVQADHDVNQLFFDRDGTLYFGVGSGTNSGVVASEDPVNQKWLAKFPDARDIACRDIRLTGVTFDDPKGKTGAYQALGRGDARELRGEAMCTSAIYRLRPGTTTPELVAWGFRNPVALARGTDGALLVGHQGADVRSTRPIASDVDSVLRVRDGAWYGWPDYGSNLAAYPNPPLFELAGSNLTAPDRADVVAVTEPHAAISGMAIAPDGAILIAEMGDFKPLTAPDKTRAGYQVERIDPRSGTIAPLLRNRGSGDAAPASTLDLRNGFERPVDVRIGPDGLIYVLDFGAFVTSGGEPKAFPKTGKLFRVERK